MTLFEIIIIKMSKLDYLKKYGNHPSNKQEDLKKRLLKSISKDQTTKKAFIHDEDQQVLTFGKGLQQNIKDKLPSEKQHPVLPKRGFVEEEPLS